MRQMPYSSTLFYITNWKHNWIGSINVLEFLLNSHKIPVKAIHNSSLLQMKAGSVDLNILRRC
uniref:Uncharacterized protein n=1 Tax=uncultured marine microorganism HF4000_007D16 TaxID=455510 RepID=B3T0U8_9ZZZZ|nr:hypothetical protein ALOHA_HF4000007D16ctg1g16 [uncultured marine microorganism HF4000_007D16]